MNNAILEHIALLEDAYKSLVAKIRDIKRPCSDYGFHAAKQIQGGTVFDAFASMEDSEIVISLVKTLSDGFRSWDIDIKFTHSGKVTSKSKKEFAAQFSSPNNPGWKSYDLPRVAELLTRLKPDFPNSIYFDFSTNTDAVS